MTPTDEFAVIVAGTVTASVFVLLDRNGGIAAELNNNPPPPVSPILSNAWASLDLLDSARPNARGRLFWTAEGAGGFAHGRRVEDPSLPLSPMAYDVHRVNNSLAETAMSSVEGVGPQLVATVQTQASTPFGRARASMESLYNANLATLYVDANASRSEIIIRCDRMGPWTACVVNIGGAAGQLASGTVEVRRVGDYVEFRADNVQANGIGVGFGAFPTAFTVPAGFAPVVQRVLNLSTTQPGAPVRPLANIAVVTAVGTTTIAGWAANEQFHLAGLRYPINNL